jgi:hypothetical protein
VNLDLLRSFFAASEFGGMTKAPEQRHVPPSNLTRQVQVLVIVARGGISEIAFVTSPDSRERPSSRELRKNVSLLSRAWSPRLYLDFKYRGTAKRLKGRGPQSDLIAQSI